MLDFLTTRNEMNFVSHIEGFMRLWDLCINIDTNTGFQFDGDAVIPDGDLLPPSSDCLCAAMILRFFAILADT